MSSKKSRITFINIIALLGFALLGFFTFMGAMFYSGGTLGTSIAIAVGAVVITALILSAAVYSKTVDCDFSKWKKIEIVTVVVFWLFAAVPAYYVMHFFEIITAKESLQKIAEDDVKAINNMFRDYELFEREALGVTRTGLENAFGQPTDRATNRYMTENLISGPAEINSWISRQQDILTGTRGINGFAYLPYKETADSIAEEWNRDVQSWNLMAICSSSGKLKSTAKTIAEDLTANSQRGKLPVIVFDNGTYVIDSENQTVTITEPNLNFPQKLKTAGKFNPLYCGIYVIIMLLIFLDYIMARRSDKTDISIRHNTGNFDGGMSL